MKSRFLEKILSSRNDIFLASRDKNIFAGGNEPRLYNDFVKDYNNSRNGSFNHLAKEIGMCFYSGSRMEDAVWYYGMKIFLLVWIVFVPIAITARLEKIIKLLEEKK